VIAIRKEDIIAAKEKKNFYLNEGKEPVGPKPVGLNPWGTSAHRQHGKVSNSISRVRVSEFQNSKENPSL